MIHVVHNPSRREALLPPKWKLPKPFFDNILAPMPGAKVNCDKKKHELMLVKPGANQPIKRTYREIERDTNTGTNTDTHTDTHAYKYMHLGRCQRSPPVYGVG